MRILPAIALLATGCFSTILAPPLTCPGKGGRAWNAVQSPHFELYSDVAPEKAQEAVLEFERVFDVFHEVVFSGQRVPETRLRVVLFDRERDFDALAPFETTDAYFFRDADGRPSIVMHGELTLRARTVFQHELTHRFVHLMPARVPLWLNEGLATYLETMTIDRDTVTFGHATMRGLDPSRLPSVAKLLVDDGDGFHGDQTAFGYYAGASNLVHLLAVGPAPWGGRLNPLLRALASETSPSHAWKQVMGDVPPARLEQAYREYYLSPWARSVRTRYEVQGRVTMYVRPMSDEDVHLAWAALRDWSKPEGSAQAVTDVEEALRVAPASSEAQLLARQAARGRQERLRGGPRRAATRGG